MSKTQITAEPGIPQIIIAREFGAPRDLVYRAHVDPELLVRWLGPRDLAMTIDHYDARNGGTWRYKPEGHRGQPVRLPRCVPRRPRRRMPSCRPSNSRAHPATSACRPCIPAEHDDATPPRARSWPSSRSTSATRWSPPAWNEASATPVTAWPSRSPGCRRADPSAASRQSQQGRRTPASVTCCLAARARRRANTSRAVRSCSPWSSRSPWCPSDPGRHTAVTMFGEIGAGAVAALPGRDRRARRLGLACSSRGWPASRAAGLAADMAGVFHHHALQRAAQRRYRDDRPAVPAFTPPPCMQAPATSGTRPRPSRRR